ncbi:MAG: hypothetical protein EBR82_78515 [Caulobacteraceae bacterium]|nr:hypothetical protein [Caulobacteraceae bacterium]
MRPRGGIFGKNVLPSLYGGASGCWTLREQEAYARDLIWPVNVLVYDTFTASNGTAISGRTPSPRANGANTWSTATWSGDGNVAACQIQNNQAQQTTYASSTYNSFSHVYCNCGTSDVTVSATCVIGSRDGSYSYCGPIARFTTYGGNFGGSFIIAQIISNNLGSVGIGYSLFLRSFNAGSVTTLASSSVAIAYDTPYVVTLKCAGSNITATWNGVTLTGTSTVNQTVTSHGFCIGHTDDKGSGAQTYVDNLSISAP